MKRSIIFLALCISLNGIAQSEIAVWTIVSSGYDAESQEAEIIFSVDLNKTWNIYASDFSAPIGPLPTLAEFRPDRSFQLINQFESVKSSEALDRSWDLSYTYFSNHAEFRQRIKVNGRETKIKGVIRGQYFNQVSDRKLDFKKQFEVIIKPALKGVIAKKDN